MNAGQDTKIRGSIASVTSAAAMHLRSRIRGHCGHDDELPDNQHP